MVEHAYATQRPSGFREDLIDPEYQRRDEEAWAATQAKLKVF
jgi:hypothetical protein